jgi:hypothetical protein
MNLPKEFLPENLDAMEVFPPKEEVSLRERLALLSRRSRDMQIVWEQNVESMLEPSIRISKVVTLSTLSIMSLLASGYQASSGREVGAIVFLAASLLTEGIGLRAIYAPEDNSLQRLRQRRMRL